LAKKVKKEAVKEETTVSSEPTLSGISPSARDFISPRICIGFHSHGSVHPRFAYALARACAYEGNKIAGVIPVIGPLLEDCRNSVVSTFLEQFPEVDYLLMVDADIEFPSDAIGKSLFILRYFGQDVFYGNYSLGDGRNSIFTKTPDCGLFRMVPVVGDQTYLGIAGGGTGWLLSTRALLEKMKEKFPKPFIWFARDLVKDDKGETTALGEDLTFGKRAGECGAKQMGSSQIALLHYKERAIIPNAMVELVGQQYPGAEYMEPK
jgi:hypothetical protein